MLNRLDRLLAVTLSLLASPAVSQSGPVVSEIMAANIVTLADEDGHSSDWIEIHNPTTNAIDVGGWFLTDDNTSPRKWSFPKPTSIGASGFLVVFASAKNRSVAGKQLHTNFSLKRGGEYVGLADATGKLVSDLGAGYPRQYPDISYGLEFKPTLTTKKVYFPWGSPGRANGLGAAVVGDVFHRPLKLSGADDCVVTAEVVNPNRAKVNSIILSYRVDFAAETGLAMRDDGKAPDRVANDDRWTALIPASKYATGQMVRWRIKTSIQGGASATVPVNLSSINSPAYFGTMVDDPASNTGLRTFHWWVAAAWRANTTTGTRCSVFFDGEFYDNVMVRIRGNTSKTYPKQSYKFDFNKGYHLLYDPKKPRVEEVNLNTTYADKAFIRQILAYETFRDSGADYSVTFPVRQQQNGKFFMVSIFTEQVDEEYLERQGLDSTGALYKVYNQLERFSSGRLEQKITTPAGYADIRLLISSIAFSGAARDRYLWDNIDIPACINYWAGTVLMHDNDSVAKNYYLYRDSYGDGEWRFLPWDKDLVFGRNYTGSVLNDTIWAERDPQSHPLYGDSSHQKIDRLYNRLVNALLREPVIREMYLRRLRTLMDSLLNDLSTPVAKRYYERRIDTLERRMTTTVALDKAKWGVPQYGNRSLDFHSSIDILESSYLDRRRKHLFQTHSSNSSGIIPKSQPVSGLRMAFGTVEDRPVSNDLAEQFVEVITSNKVAIDISNWSVRGAGIEFTFEPGSVIGAGKSVFVAALPTAFRKRKSGPSGGQKLLVVGPFKGVLQAPLGLVVYNDMGFPVTETGEFPYSLTTKGSGDVRITVDKAMPRTPLRILFSLDNSGAPGSGPILGLGTDVVAQLGLPLGTPPLHILTDAKGSYVFIAPNNTLPKGLQLTSRGFYLDEDGRIVVSQVQRVTF